MANNPLQQFFRQPKIYISLPSQGVYNTPDEIVGDLSHLPVYGMTGMDEILMKTPDALITGESTVKVVQSCVPDIKDPWKLSALDVDVVLSAIRIATYGNELTVGHMCGSCGSPNEYTFDLTKLVDHYAACHYDNTVVIGNLKITTKPLNYKQTTEFALRNFQVQQKLAQVSKIENAEEQRKATADAFEELANLRNDVFAATIESVDIGGGTVVTERPYIIEWIENVDRGVMEAIKDHNELNQTTWAPPEVTGECSECGHSNKVTVSLDQANFFG